VVWCQASYAAGGSTSIGSSGGGSTSMGSSGGGSTSMGSTVVVTLLVQVRWKHTLLPLLRLMVMAGPLLLFASGNPSSLFPFKIGQSSPLALFTPDMAVNCQSTQRGVRCVGQR